MSTDQNLIALIFGFIILAAFKDYSDYLNPTEKALFIMLGVLFIFCLAGIYLKFFSKKAKDNIKKNKIIFEIPKSLRLPSSDSILLGKECDLDIPIYLSDSIRCRHVHILGATGSGKTESVILNFLKQDINRGLGAIILDAKGDQSFIDFLKKITPPDRLRVFDLSNPESLGFNPLDAGSALESSQRLFSSLNWSEEYYKSKALSALQMIFQFHLKKCLKNPNLSDLRGYLESPVVLSDILNLDPKSKSFEKEYADLSGLRDQIRSLTVGHLEKILSPINESDSISLSDSKTGQIIYFRLQSLLSPQAVQMLGRLIIQNLNYLAGTSHREENKKNQIIPIFLDEFASFASLEFADFISKARSAGFAIHFSHQSIGDVEDVAPGFMNRITDNSATKIILRINDPDSAEFFARSFGTKSYQKITQKVIKSQDVNDAELVGEGSSREAHQFRSSPDLFKTLPTGTASVLIAHGFKTQEGASHVFKIQFPHIK